MKEPTFVGPANIIFFEGLMAFYDKRIRDLLTYKIFINCDGTILLKQMISVCAEDLKGTQMRGEDQW